MPAIELSDWQAYFMRRILKRIIENTSPSLTFQFMENNKLQEVRWVDAYSALADKFGEKP